MNNIIETIENINNILIDYTANKEITDYICKSIDLQKQLILFISNPNNRLIAYQRLLYNWYLSFILLYIGKDTITKQFSDISINNYLLDKYETAILVIPKILLTVNDETNKFIEEAKDNEKFKKSDEFKEFLNEYNKIQSNKYYNIIKNAEYISLKKMAIINNNLKNKTNTTRVINKDYNNISIEQFLNNKLIYSKEINNLDNYSDCKKIIIPSKFPNTIQINELKINESLNLDENINSLYKKLYNKKSELIGMPGFLFKNRQNLDFEIKKIEKEIEETKENKKKFIYSIKNPLTILDIKSKQNNEIKLDGDNGDYVVIINNNGKLYEFDRKNKFDDLINSSELYNYLLSINQSRYIFTNGILEPNKIELPGKDNKLLLLLEIYKKDNKKNNNNEINFGKLNINKINLNNDNDIYDQYEECITNIEGNKNIENKFNELKKKINEITKEIPNEIFIKKLENIFTKFKKYICYNTLYNINNKNKINNEYEYNKYKNIAEQECKILFKSINDYIIYNKLKVN